MKSLNLLGTTSENFRIGIGNNVVDLRVIQGKLYFKNFNEPFKPLLSNDAELILSPLTWSANKSYGVGDLFYYNKILFKVIIAHVSGSSFLTNNNNYRKVCHIDGDLTKIDVASILNNIYTLNILSSDFIYLYGSGTGSFKLVLPDPTSISIGSTYFIQNSSSKIINVFNLSNQLVIQINPNENKQLTLIDYTTNDTWSVFSVINQTINFSSIDKQSVSFNIYDQKQFIGPSGIFTTDNSGKYSFYDLNDVDLNGDIFWASGGVGVKVNTFSSNVVTGNVSSKFCYFFTDNKLYFRNNTSVVRQIVFERIYK